MSAGGVKRNLAAAARLAAVAFPGLVGSAAAQAPAGSAAGGVKVDAITTNRPDVLTQLMDGR